MKKLEKTKRHRKLRKCERGIKTGKHKKIGCAVIILKSLDCSYFSRLIDGYL